jgi:small subunit ribosomal protein S1
VLRIEPPSGPKGREKIALSIRALARDPWQDAADSFPVGQRVTGTVSRLQPFGAFVELGPGIDGLVHISELGAGRRVNHPSEVLNVGDRVEATVLGVDTERRRISLSLDETKGAKRISGAGRHARRTRRRGPGEDDGQLRRASAES